MMKLGLAPMLSGLDVAYYRAKGETDPVLALAGLRIDLETMMRNVAVGFKLKVAPSGPIPRLLRRIREARAITSDVSREETEEVVKAAEVLFAQYLSWLSWGFDDTWKPSSS